MRQVSSNRFARPFHEPRLLHAFCDVEVQERLESLYLDSDPWAREAIVNVASSVTFSSDRTIVERANDVWE